MQLQTSLTEFNEKFDWHSYNESQTKEKILFMKLLKEICGHIPDPYKRTNNPKAIPMKDAVFGLALKTYYNSPIRRFNSDLRIAKEAGYISREYHFNTMKDHLHHPKLKVILKDLIEVSCLPVKPLEQFFAADATGFSSSKFVRWFDAKTQTTVKKRTWRKCHAICGVLTNCITSMEITDGDVADTTQFVKLVNQTAKNFQIEELSADKGYSSRENMEVVNEIGGVPFIPFKTNATGRSSGSPTWSKMYKYFQEHQQDFLKHYHRRSNIESVWSMIKARFGNNLRSKTEMAQENEILLKCLCHNICILIQEMFMRNLSVEFIDSCSGRKSERINR
ncbi:MAG: transposase [Candidatus Pacearchaeota archaeon]|jgi:transposase